MALQKQLLAFRLNDCFCALYLNQVLQVIQAVEATALPNAPATVIGVIDLHGQVVPLLNIRRRFEFVDHEIGIEDQFIIAQMKSRTVAIAVDEVMQIVERPAEEIVAAEKIVGNMDYLDGVTRLDDGLALIHDPDTFFSLDERRELESALAEVGHGA
jgi:purine-binding chemotaxis protein CheW